MCESFDLLVAIVRAEDEGAAHTFQCSICATSRVTADCPEATRLAIESIDALFAAKVYSDRAEKCVERTPLHLVT